MGNNMGSLEKPLEKSSLLVAVIFCAGLLSACATPKSTLDGNAEITKKVDMGKDGGIDSDPLEPLNRGIFQFNHVIDGVLLEPIARGYDEIMPECGKVMVSNFVSNINEPVTFVNSVLQADATNSFSTLWRFMLNSTVGLGGLFDVAGAVGLENRETGFGDTFAIYGADAGAYLVLPILGPSNIRDGLGRVGDVFADPVSYTNNSIFYSVVAVKTIDKRYHNLKLLEDIYKTSLDPYTTIRSGYTQHRAAEVKAAISERNKSLEAAGMQGTK